MPHTHTIQKHVPDTRFEHINHQPAKQLIMEQHNPQFPIACIGQIEYVSVLSSIYQTTIVIFHQTTSTAFH